MKKLGSLWILEDNIKGHIIGATGDRQDVLKMSREYAKLRGFDLDESTRITISSVIDGKVYYGGPDE